MDINNYNITNFDTNYTTLQLIDTTAARLMENGHNDIVILEAENRTGGRIFSIPFAQGWIDLG